MALIQLNFPKTFLVFLISFSAAQLSTAAISSSSPSPKISSLPFQKSTKNLLLLQNLTTFSLQQSNISCFFDNTCYDRSGMHSRCYNGACICDLGYFPSSLDAACSRVYCTTDDDQCSTLFPNTVCQTSFAGGSCVCDQSSHLDLPSQTCSKKRPPQPPAYCSTDDQCWHRPSYGYNAFCNSSSFRCDCELGYTRQLSSESSSDDQLGCTHLDCTVDVDCSSRWANTECDVFGSCICGQDYLKKSRTQTCVPISSGGGGGGGGGDGMCTKSGSIFYFIFLLSFLGMAIGSTIVVLVICVTACCCIALCSKSKQQPQPPPHRRVFRQPPTNNSTNQLSAAANRRLPLSRLTIPTSNSSFSSMTAFSQTMDTPPPAYTEAVQQSSAVQLGFPPNSSPPPQYTA